MSSRISSVIRIFLRTQRHLQRRASIRAVRRISPWIDRLFSVPTDLRWEKLSRGDFTYEWFIPNQLATPQILFHIHGGGFVLPLYNPERSTIAYLSRLTGARTLMIDYRLAPEHPFPSAVEDCAAAYRWLIDEEGFLPEQVIFSGESAGGNLVLTTMLSLRDEGSPLPAGGVALCPVLDFEGIGTFYTQDDPMALADFVMMQLTAYRGNSDPRTPLLSPLYADLENLPPLLIQVGEDELLRSGAEIFAVRASRVGVQVQLQIWPRMWHFWHLFVPWLPEAREAMAEIERFISSCHADYIQTVRRPNNSLERTGDAALKASENDDRRNNCSR